MKAIRIIGAMAVSLVGAVFTSCNHKDLVYDFESRSEVVVVYDWSKAPDANPSAMELRMHPVDAPTDVVNFFFQNINGGTLRAPVGDYSCVSLNGDLTDWAQLRDHNDPDAFEIYTVPVVTLPNSGIRTNNAPRARDTEDEQMVATPESEIWADRLDNIGIHNTPGVQTITFYPEELVCHYTVDIYDVTHSEYLQSPILDATISGMSEGVHPGRKQANENAATMPFTMRTDADKGVLNASFLTFGETPGTARKHMLTVYLTLTDGSKWYATADVTDQVTTAPDPRHVHIVLSGLDLPKPINNSGGIIPDVDEWDEIHITLPM